jgi:hypothetical protein
VIAEQLNQPQLTSSSPTTVCMASGVGVEEMVLGWAVVFDFTITYI